MQPKQNDIRLPVTVGGVTFKNPFYVASGPTAKTVRQLLRIEETGWAAASIKLSIDPAPYINREPRYSTFDDLDALAFTAEKRLTMAQGLALIREAKPKLKELKLIANITYAGDDGACGWARMAKEFERAGADVIELNMCCPNMSYNTELTSGGSKASAKQTGASMGRHADIAAEIVKAVKQAIQIPLFLKLTPEGGEIARVAQAAYASGADAVGSTANRLGMPPINLAHPERAFCHLQDEISMGCYSGGWLKPLAQRDTYEICKVNGTEHAITATGGIRSWEDAVQMVLCGASLMGVCAETLINGYDIVRPMIEGLSRYMRDRGVDTLSALRGNVVPHLRSAPELTLYAGYARIKDPTLSAPCKAACPLHVPIQAYVSKIAKGELREAYELITAKSPLQGVCALFCGQMCERACVRGSYDSPVEIQALKRFVLQKARENGWTPKCWAQCANGIRVAVIGAGARGLACAEMLSRAGYGVTVFEKSARAGGALRLAAMGDPAMLGQIDAEIEALKARGVRFMFEYSIKDARALLAEGFAHVYAATGAGLTPFLSAVDSGKITPVAGCAAVIGAGAQTAYTAMYLKKLGTVNVTWLVPSGADARLAELAKKAGVSVIEHAKNIAKDDSGVTFELNAAILRLDCDMVLDGEARITPSTPDACEGVTVDSSPHEALADVIACGVNAAAAIDRALRGDKATLSPLVRGKTVSPELVKKRVGYVKRVPRKAFMDGTGLLSMTAEEAAEEASKCLKCGCGEGCQLCKTICADFAPQIVDTDTLAISREECEACGMCYKRCPNGNIEMVSLGTRV